MATFSAHIDCPECNEPESIHYSKQRHFVLYYCHECGYDWEEDYDGLPGWHHKSVGFGGLYKGQAAVRAMYEKHRGPIPGGWHLHHIDHNPDNNNIGNLIAVPKDIHDLIHANPRAYGSRTSIDTLLTTKK